MFIDTHCHLNFHQFDADRDAVVQRALDAGVAVIINPAVDLTTSRQAIDLAEQYPGVYAQVGVHPNDCADFEANTIAELAELARHPKVVAIGEIGLDYYWERVPHPQQWAAFEAQLELAARLDLPVVLHCRDAHADLRDALRKWVPGAQMQRSGDAILGVLHAYSGDLDMAQEAFGWNMMLSFGGPLTFRNAKDLHTLLGHLPLDHLMLETDAPYLTPHPHRGKRNEPAYIALIAQGLAEIKKTDVVRIAQTTSALAKAVFAKLALDGHN
ncbi:MAG TPA: TatD family hydrolase [Anaerolineae bacterium]|nr:TatD family hydrolase [Anaerolineae bacterium]